jgi:NTP pyrophosphatase (non-canonical NTP hydrolase)
MDIQNLTQAMHSFVRAKGWYEPDSPRPQNLRNLAISLNIEAAEVLEHFQWNGNLADQKALADELADVALYLLQLASLAEIDLEQAILAKLEMNYQRTWDNAPATDSGETQPAPGTDST